MSDRPIDYEYKKINDDFYIVYIKNFSIKKVDEMVKSYNDENGYEILKIEEDNEFCYIPSISYVGDKDIFNISLAIMDDPDDRNLIEIFSEYSLKDFIDIMNYINNENIKIDENTEKVDIIGNDIVNNPNHYQLNIKGNNVEVIDIIDEVVKDYSPKQAFRVANIIKYVLRASKKNGLEDFKKAKKYIEMLLEIEG